MGEKKLYIGTKFIKAEPMTAEDFEKFTGKKSHAEIINEKGYFVEYPGGYVSWSPKDVFEASYRLVSDAEFSLMLTSKSK